MGARCAPNLRPLSRIGGCRHALCVDRAGYPCRISFNGGDIPIGGANPLPTDATLTGLFSPLFISLDGGGTETILPNFSASIAFAENGLEDGSFALIEATPSTTPAPEPETLPLLLIGIGALALARRTRQRKT